VGRHGAGPGWWSGDATLTHKLAGSRVLITGGAGLVGAHIADALMGAGVAEVIAIVDHSPCLKAGDSWAEHCAPDRVPCRDRLPRSLEPGVSAPLHRRRFPQALRYAGSLLHGVPGRQSSPALKGGVFWRRMITSYAATATTLPAPAHADGSPSWRATSATASSSPTACRAWITSITRRHCALRSARRRIPS